MRSSDHDKLLIIFMQLSATLDTSWCAIMQYVLIHL